MYLQGGCEEVTLGYDVHKEVWGDLSELVIEHADEAQEELLVRAHGLLRATQQCQQLLPVLEGVVRVPNQEAHEGKLQLA